MRILLSGNPSAGHILPMMPIADAARAAGHETALLTSGGLASLVAPLRVLPAGPTMEYILEATITSTGSDPTQPGPGAIEMFAGVRVDLTFDEALRQAEGFEPDLMVCEQFDFVGPLVAARLGVPWAAHAISGPVPEPLWDALHARMAREYESRALTATPRIALVDPYPDALRSPTEQPAEDRITIQPGVNEHGAAQSAESASGGESTVNADERPCALVTVGTTVRDRDALSALASSVAAAGFTTIVTAEAEELSADIDLDRVRAVGFVPLAKLLPQVDLVVTAGGSGTVLAALSRGLPMVVRPFFADQPWNAARLADMGAGIVIDDFTEAGAAARQIVENSKYREAAQGAAAELAAMNPPESVLRELMSLSGLAAK